MNRSTWPLMLRALRLRSSRSSKHKRPTLLLTAALPVVFGFALWSAPSYADDEAVTRFERGVQLFEAENYEGALVEFNTAYKLSKNYKLLYNIGICQNALKD